MKKIETMSVKTRQKLDEIDFDPITYHDKLKYKRDYAYPKGSRYSGEMNGNKRHGLG